MSLCESIFQEITFSLYDEGRQTTLLRRDL